jgi:outer membrane protein assembly factor BamB
VYRWSREVPLLGRALVVAGGTMFVAGPPDVVDQEQTAQHIGEPAAVARLAAQSAALAGRRGGLLWAVSAASGEKIAEYKLDSPPVFDGLIAANGRLYMTTMDGKVLCMGAE